MKPTLEWTDQLICVAYAIHRSWIDWNRNESGEHRVISYVCVCVFVNENGPLNPVVKKKDQNRYGGNANNNSNHSSRSRSSGSHHSAMAAWIVTFYSHVDNRIFKLVKSGKNTQANKPKIDWLFFKFYMHILCVGKRLTTIP